MKRVTENANKKMTRLNTAFLVPAILLFINFGVVNLHAGPSPEVTNPTPSARQSENIRDYVCIVNRHVHPNMERYLNAAINGLIAEGDEASDNYALTLEYEKRGGSGSGFIYLDSNGNNYIITNYHVIVGAYRLSVTFENEKKEKYVIRNLSVFSVNEQEDLAILAFPDGQKPFTKGIPISTTQLRDGSPVFAAGYPGGISNTPTWNLTDGRVSNNDVTPRGEAYSYIQHSASINPGNSGGPLLVEDTRSPVGFNVVGINTLIIRNIGGGNFSIPAGRLNAFLQRSFQQTDERVSLESRIRPFMELLERSTTNEYVYEELSSFLSSTMINANPEKTVSNLPDSMDIIWDKMMDDMVVGISWAVSYTQIEIPIYLKSRNDLARAIGGMPEILSIEQNNWGGYTARLLIKGYPYRTEWIREYGTWKLDDFIEDAGEYNDYHELANPHPMGKKVIYSFSSRQDYDWYTLNISKAGRLTVRTEGNIDPQLDIYYDPSVIANQRPIASNDDFRGLNAQISTDVRAGTVWVRVSRAAGDPGEYILLAGLDGEIDNIPYVATTTSTTTTSTNSGPQVTVVNNTGSRISIVYISETTSESWGQNRLASNQTIGNGESVSLQLPRPINQVNRYDIMVRDSSQNDYIKWDYQVSANGRIVFTSSDRQ